MLKRWKEILSLPLIAFFELVSLGGGEGALDVEASEGREHVGVGAAVAATTWAEAISGDFGELVVADIALRIHVNGDVLGAVFSVWHAAGLIPVDVLIGADGSLDVAHVKDAVGRVGAIFPGTSSDEENGGQREEDGDHYGQFE